MSICHRFQYMFSSYVYAHSSLATSPSRTDSSIPHCIYIRDSILRSSSFLIVPHSFLIVPHSFVFVPRPRSRCCIRPLRLPLQLRCSLGTCRPSVRRPDIRPPNNTKGRQTAKRANSQTGSQSGRQTLTDTKGRKIIRH